MSTMIRRLLTGSAIAAGIVALMAVTDMILGVPFAGEFILMDIMFLISALLIIYMVWQCFQELH